MGDPLAAGTVGHDRDPRVAPEDGAVGGAGNAAERGRFAVDRLVSLHQRPHHRVVLGGLRRGPVVDHLQLEALIEVGA